MTCPNRDGTLDSRGCIFCAGGSGDFAEKPDLSVFNQIEKAKLRIKNKMHGNRFIAYFQSYTNTYAPLQKLKALFYKAASHPDIVGLSVATRPDCIDKDTADLLGEINAVKPVFVELGLQTCREDIADFIRRYYKNDAYERAVEYLSAKNIHTVAHIIFGLPGEDEHDMLNSVRYVIKSGAQGIKIHLLYVLKGTDLQKLYLSGAFDCLDKLQYIGLIADAINIMPPDMVVHRITGDAPKKLLIAPLWSADKKRVLNDINRFFEQNNVVQGKYYQK